MSEGGAIPIVSDRDLEQARLELIRRRVTVFSGVLAGLLVLLTLLQWWMVRTLLSDVRRPSLFMVVTGLAVAAAVYAVPRIRRRAIESRSLRSLVYRTIWLVVMSVVSQFGPASIVAQGLTELLRRAGSDATLGVFWPLLAMMLVVHTAASVVVPWTVREALIPPLLWIAVLLIAPLLGGQDGASSIMLAAVLTLAAGAPGTAVAALRSSRLRERVGLRILGERYAEVERELAFARRLHERLFAPPLRDGPVRLEYAYEPMRQIGGDYLDVSAPVAGARWIVLIDVTGHGVAAALAVNRLHGELKRLLAEGVVAGPAGLLAELNRYVHLTLADESVFATAAACRVPENGPAVLAVSGHPPPMLKTAAGVRLIDPTAPMLGAFPPEAFEVSEEILDLAGADRLVLYTDGAVESRDAHGRDLGIAGLRSIIENADDPTPERIMDAVRSRRAGSAEDDTLIAVVRRA